jgi:membrane protein YqaA with SNARE-associated domain
MESLNEFFIDYGYIGMMMAAFLAGSFVPFSSEAVMGALLAASTMDPWLTILFATIGNVGGTMFNYYLGRLGNINTISKWLKVKEEKIEKAKRYVNRRGSWIAVFTFLPIMGTAIAIALGMLRTNVLTVLFYTTIGKVIRYIMVAFTVVAFKSL